MFRPLEAIIRSRFGYPGGGIKFKVANGTGRGRWRARSRSSKRIIWVHWQMWWGRWGVT